MDQKQHQKQPNDKKFRLVNIFSGDVPDYQDFRTDTVTIPENYVLEVFCDNNTEYLVPPKEQREVVNYSVIPNESLFAFPVTVPAARLWIHCRRGGIEYKVPNSLRKDNAGQYVYIPGGTENVELVGDKYFSCAIILKRI